MRVRQSLGLAALLALGTDGCAGPNLWTDGTSVSTGRTNRGRVRRPAVLPARGEGFRVPRQWRERGLQYGVDELVAAVARAAGRVRAQAPGAVLGVADLSTRTGGSSQWHRSHHSGRDVDLIFYTSDTRGRPQPPLPDDMLHFHGDGKPYAPRRVVYLSEEWDSRRFDTRRNWLLVEALITDPHVRVQWIFVSRALKRRLLAQARRAGRPAWVVALADRLLNQPGDAPPHDDHFHVRIYCPRSDRFHGCEDRGVVWRHEKKGFKYAGPERYDPVLWHLVSAPGLLMAG